MTSIVLTLPPPISANRYWRSFRMGPRIVTVVSAEAKAYKASVALHAALAGIKTPIAGRVRVEYWYYPHCPKDAAKRVLKLGPNWDDEVQAIDLDNCTKVLMDALKGVVMQDDKWVWALHGYRREPDAKGARVIVRISEWKG